MLPRWSASDVHSCLHCHICMCCRKTQLILICLYLPSHDIILIRNASKSMGYFFIYHQIQFQRYIFLRKINSITLLSVKTILVQKCHGRVYFVNTACFFSSRVTLNLFCAIFIALFSLLCRLCRLLFILNIIQIGNSYFLLKFRNKVTLGTTLFIYAQCFLQFIGTASGNVCEC